MKTLLASMILIALPSMVAAEPIQVSRSVATADLDLSTQKGQRALDRRLTIAIDDACGETSAVDLAGRNDIRTCRADAWAKVEAEREQRLAQAVRAKEPIAVGR